MRDSVENYAMLQSVYFSFKFVFAVITRQCLWKIVLMQGFLDTTTMLFWTTISGESMRNTYLLHDEVKVLEC